MLTFFLIWIFLSIPALWLISFRADSAAYFEGLVDFILQKNPLVSFFNLVFTMILLPLTIPKNLFHLLK